MERTVSDRKTYENWSCYENNRVYLFEIGMDLIYLEVNKSWTVFSDIHLCFGILSLAILTRWFVHLATGMFDNRDVD